MGVLIEKFFFSNSPLKKKIENDLKSLRNSNSERKSLYHKDTKKGVSNFPNENLNDISKRLNNSKKKIVLFNEKLIELIKFETIKNEDNKNICNEADSNDSNNIKKINVKKLNFNELHKIKNKKNVQEINTKKNINVYPLADKNIKEKIYKEEEKVNLEMEKLAEDVIYEKLDTICDDDIDIIDITDKEIN